MATENGRYVCCPTCNGKGQLHRSELIEQLNDPQRDAKIRAYLHQISEEEQQHAEAAQAAADFDSEVHSWPPKRILWRRSPKE